MKSIAPPSFVADVPPSEPYVELITSFRRHFWLRWVRLMLMTLPIGFVMAERGAPVWGYVLLMIGAMGWPALMLWCRHRGVPARRIDRIDVFGEFLLAGLGTSALMAFNAMPALVIYVAVGVAATTLGGWPWLLQGTLVYAAALLAGAAMTDWQFSPHTSLFVYLGSVPLHCVPLWSARGVGCVIRDAQRQQRLLEVQTRKDALTGLYNRGYWEAALRHAFVTCRQAPRYPMRCTLVIADLDHFKSINDDLGHDVGDRVISAFAALLRERLPEHFICGRYGGEEFGIIMPDTSVHEALPIVERLRRALAAMSLDPVAPVAPVDAAEPDVLDPRRGITASFGLAEWAPSMADHRAWIRVADQMLYRAKATGRDRSVAMPPADEPELAMSTPAANAVDPWWSASYRAARDEPAAAHARRPPLRARFQAGRKPSTVR